MNNAKPNLHGFTRMPLTSEDELELGGFLVALDIGDPRGRVVLHRGDSRRHLGLLSATKKIRKMTSSSHHAR